MINNQTENEWIVLKNNVGDKDYFAELCESIANNLGPCTVFSSTRSWVPPKKVRLINSVPYVKKTNFTKLISWIKYFVESVSFLVNLEKKSNLFIVCSPPMLPIAGFLYKKLYHKEYILWIDDIYPDILYSKNIITKNSFIAKLWEGVNQKTFKYAKNLITISPLMSKRLSKYVPNNTSKEKIKIIPTWVDTDEIRPIKKVDNRFAIEHEQLNKMTVLYSGNFGNTHDIKTLIKVAEQLSFDDEINFLFIGEGQDFEFYKEKEYNLKNTKFLSWRPRNELKYSLACADIGLVTLQKGIEELSMPSKTYYYMAAGAAVIGVSDTPSDLNILLNQNKCGYNFKPGSVKEIADKILFLKSNGKILNELKEHSRSYAVNYVSKKKCIKKVLRLL